MRRCRFPVQVAAAAASADASFAAAAMSYRPPYRGGRSRGRGRKSFSDRPYSEAGRDQVVTGDSHFQSVREANLGIRHGAGGGQGDLSNLDSRPSRPRHFNHGERSRQPPPQLDQVQPFHQPPFNQNEVFRPPPPRNHRPSFHQPYRPPSNQSCNACPPPRFYQRHVSRPPPQPHRQPRSKPSDYREWEYAKTAPPSGSEKFVLLSYNILADYLANDHRGKLYFHIPRNMLDWEWRKSRIMFELGLWSADIMCLQEVDRFQDLEDELKLRGYSGIWKMRTGNAVDGCAIFWRSQRFKLVREESIEFNTLGLRDNVAQICVLELLDSHKIENEVTPSKSSAGPHRVVICNIHVLYNPRRGEFKLGQVRTLLERAHAVSKHWDNAPVVLCGDFNCTPMSPLYNFILEQKLDLSGLARDKVSGQDSAVIHAPRLDNPNMRFPSVSKPLQVEIQLSDSVSRAQRENNGNRNEENVPPVNTSGLQCSETILVGTELTSHLDQVSSSEHPGSIANTESKNRECHDFGDPHVAEDLSSVTKSNPEIPRASNAETSVREEFSQTSILSVIEGSVTGNSDDLSSQGIIASDTNNSSSVSAEFDSLLEKKLEDLALNEPDESVKDGDGLVEDDKTFLAALHNEDLGHTGRSADILIEFLPELDSEAFNDEKIAYDPSSWTPMEIATATGDPERTTIEHPLQLTSTYTEVEGQSNARDANGEPVVTSYNRCFMGTVDYIWRSEGLRTVRVLAPMPKHAMQWTSGFPTPKWGSDHIALVSELAFCEDQPDPARSQVNPVARR